MGKAPSVIAGASGYPNAPTRTCSGDFTCEFQLSSFHTWSSFYLPSNDMLDSFCPIPECMTTHLSYHRFLLMELLVLSQLRLKATNRKSGRQHFQKSYVLASCLGTDGRVGAEGSKPPLLNHAMSFANQARHQIMSTV